VSAEFETLLLQEFAALMPDVDIVHVHHPSRHMAEPVDTEAAGLALGVAARSTAALLVRAWDAAFGADDPTPASIDVGYSTVAPPGSVRPVSSARLAVDAGGPADAEALAAALSDLGWSTTIRAATASNVNILGIRTEFRLDVVVQPAAHRRALRVTGPVVAVGDAVSALHDEGGRSIPWPTTRR
jgi:hypothetical protein